MILPTKYVPFSDSLLAAAATLLARRTSNETVSQVWHSYRSELPDATFDSFTKALTILFMLGLVSLHHGVIIWQV